LWWCVVGLLVAFGMLGMGRAASAVPPDTVWADWRQANAAYEQGRYEVAVDRYTAVLDAGYVSGALYYNLGTAYYRLGRVGQSVRYYEKARRLRPDDPRIAHNLRMVRDDVPELSAPAVLSPWVRIAGGWAPVPLFWAGAILFAAGVAGWTLRKVRSGSDSGEASSAGSVSDWANASWLGPATVAVAGIGLACALTAGAASYVQTLDRRAVVVAARAPLFPSPTAAPASGATASGAPASGAPSPAADTSLVEGAVVSIERRQDGWTRVTVPGGPSGWTPDRALGEI
jgi:hypothetical protein